MAALTCHTTGCPNAGAVIVLDIIDPDTGEQVDVFCGPCGQPITDIAPDADEAGAGGDDPWPY